MKRLLTETIMWEGQLFYSGILQEIPDSLEKALKLTPPELVGDEPPPPLGEDTPPVTSAKTTKSKTEAKPKADEL